MGMRENSMLLFNKRRVTSGQKALTKEQTKKLLSGLRDVEEQAIITLAIYTGIRREDIVAIERSKINFEESSIIFFEGKKKAHHKVFLNQEVIKALQMWLNRAPKSKWLFPSPINLKKHRTGRGIYNTLQTALSRAGLPARPFHALRATCIKLHQAAGLSPEQTAKIVNDSIRTIQQHYTTPSDEEMKSIIQKVNII